MLWHLMWAHEQRVAPSGHLRELVDHDPDDPSARLNLAIALVRSGSPDEAVAHVERSLELRPGHESALELARKLRTNGGAD